MTLQITGKNLDIGSALRDYVQERIEQRLEKFVGEDMTGHIRIAKEHGQFRTDCSLQLKSGLQLQSHGESEDAHASVDVAIDRLEKRTRRYTRRLKEHHNNQAKPSHAGTQASDYVVESGESEHEDTNNDNPVIIAETTTLIHETSVSDAVMQLDLSESAILVFKNAGHGRMNVVYRRPDGNIGWIDPQNETTAAKSDS